jgi:hypothetical protein
MHRYSITITEIEPTEDGEREIQRYQQIVDSIDMNAIINAVNTGPRQRALRSDAGKPRKREEVA